MTPAPRATRCACASDVLVTQPPAPTRPRRYADPSADWRGCRSDVPRTPPAPTRDETRTSSAAATTISSTLRRHFGEPTLAVSRTTRGAPKQGALHPDARPPPRPGRPVPQRTPWHNPSAHPTRYLDQRGPKDTRALHAPPHPAYTIPGRYRTSRGPKQEHACNQAT
ncbi:hypothetical protein C8F04DRAFT_1132718 [Mycena alexandri]|uniref:Uncharacterized protein n=1 Tax=Mycena alexandri TaxID=1745969 RepID=A0AAD6S9U5_9AGAR|nr:hypothetical protein C8F04DRAFT_1132718 [Mycena alexandri]